MTVRLALSELTTHQAAIATLRAVEELTERVTDMAQEIDNLNAAVDKELADDAAQNELIAELKRQLAEAAAAVEFAQSGETDALAKASEALSAAQAAADELGTNDAPAEDA